MARSAGCEPGAAVQARVGSIRRRWRLSEEAAVPGDQARTRKPGLRAPLLSSPAVVTVVSLHSGRRGGCTRGDGPCPVAVSPQQPWDSVFRLHQWLLFLETRVVCHYLRDNVPRTCRKVTECRYQLKRVPLFPKKSGDPPRSLSSPRGTFHIPEATSQSDQSSLRTALRNPCSDPHFT